MPTLRGRPGQPEWGIRTVVTWSCSGGERLETLRRAVGGAVVDEHDLVLAGRHRLVEQGLDAAVDALARLEHGHDHAHLDHRARHDRGGARATVRHPDRGRRPWRGRGGARRDRARALRRDVRADRLDRRPAHQPGGPARRAPLDRALRLHGELPPAARRDPRALPRPLPADERGPHGAAPQPRRVHGVAAGHEPRVSLAVIEAMLAPRSPTGG